MPRNSGGAYSPPGGTAAVAIASIRSTAYNTLIADIGNEITGSLDRLGRSTMLAALPMGTYGISGMANGALAQDATTYSQMNTAIAASAATVTAAYSALFPVSNANLATMPTLTVKANLTGGTAAPANVTMAALAAVLPVQAPAPVSYRNKVITVTGVTSIAITADALSVEDVSGTLYRLNAYSQAIATGGIGAGGMDTGTLGASLWYYVWAIYNPVAPATSAILSLSSTAPTMPAGYTAKQLLGAVRANSFSQLILQVQRGREVQRLVPAPLSTGVVGDPYAGTYVAVPMANYIPPIAARMTGNILTGATTNGAVIAAPNPSYGAIGAYPGPPVAIASFSSGFPVSAPWNFIVETSNVYWASFNGGGIASTGWEDNF